MFVPGAVGYVILSGWSPLLAHLKGAVYGRVSVYDLSVIPLFMLMGAFAVQGGLSKALFDFANALLGRFKGGMAMAGGAGVRGLRLDLGLDGGDDGHHRAGGLSGDAPHGVLGALATAALATGGTMGVLLPPSVTLMVYAILTEQNIIKTFLAAYVPALLAAAGYIAAIAVIRAGEPRTRRSAGRARRRGLADRAQRLAHRRPSSSWSSAASTAACSRRPRAPPSARC